MSNIILCIDDEPIRYAKLAKHLASDTNDSLAPEITVVVTHKLQDVHFYLNLPDVYRIVGVCLDCDMPNSEQGFYYASHILNERSIPVVIASHNPGEATKCHEALNEYATPNMILPASDDDDWVRFVVDFFESN